MARNRTARRLRWALLLVAVAVVVLLGLTGYQALQARTHLERVASGFDTLGGQLAEGDQPGARATLATVQREARDARESTAGPGWWVSARLPSVGPNVRAVQSVARVTDRLASDVFPDVVSASQTLRPDRLRPRDGRIDLEPIRAGAPAVVRAAEALSVQARHVEQIDVRPLAPQIGGPVARLQDKIERADGLADRASRAVRLLPSMLGADGPRRYLFMFQNNAELRAGGGIPGSFAVLTADDGRLTMGRQDDAAGIGRFAEPPIPLTAEEVALFGRQLGMFPQDVNFTPDFPRTAELAAAMWQDRRGQRVDGVVSVDPVALSYLLKGTGPVETPGGVSLTSENAVRLLLDDVYANIPEPSAQNDFFDATAAGVFDAVAGGEGRPQVVLENLVRAADERRLLAWSARPAEQRLLAPTAMGSALPTGATAVPEVGVYLNAAKPYKLDYYLDYRASVASTGCAGDRQRLRVTVDFHSSVPRRAAGLSTYVAPPNDLFGRGSTLTTVFVALPAGGSLERVRLAGAEQNVDARPLDGRPVVAQTVAVRPGQTERLTVDLLAGDGQTDTAHLQVTPGARGTGLGAVTASSC